MPTNASRGRNFVGKAWKGILSHTWSEVVQDWEGCVQQWCACINSAWRWRRMLACTHQKHQLGCLPWGKGEEHWESPTAQVHTLTYFWGWPRRAEVAHFWGEDHEPEDRPYLWNRCVWGQLQVDKALRETLQDSGPSKHKVTSAHLLSTSSAAAKLWQHHITLKWIISLNITSVKELYFKILKFLYVHRY